MDDLGGNLMDNQNKKNILLLAANPKETTALDLDKEQKKN